MVNEEDGEFKFYMKPLRKLMVLTVR